MNDGTIQVSENVKIVMHKAGGRLYWRESDGVFRFGEFIRIFEIGEQLSSDEDVIRERVLQYIDGPYTSNRVLAY